MRKRLSDEMKAKQLRTLYQKLREPKWTFPKFRLRQGAVVQGFLGIGPVMVVAERPSLAKFDPERLKSRRDPVGLLYAALAKCKAGRNAHVSDYLKTRAPAGSPWPEDLHDDAQMFERELDIVQPTLIVAVGSRVLLTLRHPAAARGIPLVPVMHYSYAKRRGLKRKFALQMKQALRRIHAGACGSYPHGRAAAGGA